METNIGNNINEYTCKICNKNYANKSGIWKHNNKYHSTENNQNNQKITISSNPKVTITSPCKPDGLTCKYCSKVFKFKQGRWRHEQNCDFINKDDYSKNFL